MFSKIKPLLLGFLRSRYVFEPLKIMLKPRYCTFKCFLSYLHQQVIAPKILDEKISQYFYWAEGSNKAREYLPGSVIDIPSMEIVIHPAETLRQICAFLEITCSEDYIQDCAATVDPVPSITRDYVQWTEEQKMRVYERMNRFSFYEGYTFDN